jgi:hypothetical protein
MSAGLTLEEWLKELVEARVCTPADVAAHRMHRAIPSAERLLISGIIGCPDGTCIDRCSKLTAFNFKEPIHWKIFTAYKSLRRSPDPDRTWRDPRVISAMSGVRIGVILLLGELDRQATKFNDALQHLTHVRR